MGLAPKIGDANPAPANFIAVKKLPAADVTNNPKMQVTKYTDLGLSNIPIPKNKMQKKPNTVMPITKLISVATNGETHSNAFLISTVPRPKPAAANNESGAYTNRASKIEDLTRNFSLSAGDMIYPAIRGDGSTADTIQLSMTIVIKTAIPS